MRFLIFLLLSLPVIVNGQTFKTHQLRYPRVRAAQASSQSFWQTIADSQGISFPPTALYMRGFKSEKELEVWGQCAGAWTLLHTYPFCASSGKLGPKRRQGDGQIPEGLYYIDRFNPASQFHLSLGIDYPNASDKVRSTANDLGGDIFIHGDCVTIGCIPITDIGIAQLYWLAVEVHDINPTPIPVHLFPFRFDTWREPLSAASRLWQELAAVYQYFDTNGQLPTYHIAADGTYVIE